MRRYKIGTIAFFDLLKSSKLNLEVEGWRKGIVMCGYCGSPSDTDLCKICSIELCGEIFAIYKNYLKQRLENLKKIVECGDHSVPKKIREEYWNCICSDEDVNATKCENCYGINIARQKMFGPEIRMLSELLE